MKLSGHHLIASALSAAATETFQAVNPVSGEFLPPCFAEGTATEVDLAVTKAAADFDRFRALPLRQRAEFLEAVARELLTVKAELIERCNLETGLPLQRLDGELTRTTNQLNLFAATVKDGDALYQVQIEPALPAREPLPKPDLRLTRIPIGPVAVFGASNFPLAFSVAGGDTAAAFAAGCPVIVKGHPSHPGTAEIVATAIVRAIASCNMPEGIFSLIQGSRNDVGETLVKHPEIKAVAFTGSHAAGRALYNIAAARSEPIPVFAEMGSTNPIFVLPRALASRGTEIAEKYIDSITLGVGQFCTNPGLLFAVKGANLDQFIAAAIEKLHHIEAAPLLNSGIKTNFLSRLTRLSGNTEIVFSGKAADQDNASCQVLPTLLKTDIDTFLQREEVAEEVFGPAAIVVECRSMDDLFTAAQHLRGQLTATLHAEVDEDKLSRKMFSILEKKAGRLLLNDFPTGVEVCRAMNHGGPYPATTDSRWTSVGPAALNRFLRPVCYQNFSASLLPEELRQ